MRTRLCSMALTALLGVSIGQAGLFEDLYRGLDLLTTPSGAPVFTSGDGVRTNGQRQGRVRIVPNRAGRGWGVELDRSFGNDTRGRPETLDLGPFDVQLAGSMSGTFGYTSRGFLIGNADFGVNNMQYNLRGKTGAQDVQLTGTLAVQTSLEVNQFGFYDAIVNVSNANAQLEVDGVLARNTDDVNFDIGPINVQGNILFDAALALLTTFGVDTTGLEALSPKSPIGEINDAIRETLRQQALVAGYSVTADETGEWFLSPVVGPLPPVADAGVTSGDTATRASANSLVPEPGTLLLLGSGMALFATRLRRSRA